MTFKHLEPWRKTLYVMCVSQFIAMMGMSKVVPFLPFYIRDLGVEDYNIAELCRGAVGAVD